MRCDGETSTGSSAPGEEMCTASSAHDVRAVAGVRSTAVVSFATIFGGDLIIVLSGDATELLVVSPTAVACEDKREAPRSSDSLSDRHAAEGFTEAATLSESASSGPSTSREREVRAAADRLPVASSTSEGVKVRSSAEPDRPSRD